MTLDDLRLQMVRAVKAGDKAEQSVVFAWIRLAKEQGNDCLQAYRILRKKAESDLSVTPAGRGDLRDALQEKILILERLSDELHVQD